MRVGLLDLAFGDIRPLPGDDAGAKQVSPQWAPAGDAVYYVSDRDGVSNVYRADIPSGHVRRITDVVGGVSGVTATSPALAVASRSGMLAFSVYRNGRYEIETLGQKAALLQAVEPELFTVPETTVASAGTLQQLLDDPTTGLPATGFSSIARRSARLESIAPPFIGGSTGNAFGGVVRALSRVSSRMCARSQLQAMFRVGTDIDDLAIQCAIPNRKGQWNWGVAGGRTVAFCRRARALPAWRTC